MIQWPSLFLNVSVCKHHTKKPVTYHPNESEADQAPLQHHIELLVIIINGWKPATIVTRCSTLDDSVILYPTP